MARQPTLLDIASRIGVSTYTVSQALSGKAGVSAQTRERIVALASEMGYVVNAVAANLKGGRSSSIGVMTASGRNQYYSMLVQSIDTVLQAHGLHAVTNDAMRGGRYDNAMQRQSVQALLQQRVAAIVATYPLSPESLATIERWETPLIFVDALPPRRSRGYPFVGCDNVAAGRLVAQYFGSLKYGRVAILGYPKEWNTRAPREQSFRKCAADLGIVVDTVESDNSSEAAFAATSNHLGKATQPDAIYALNTPLLQGALRAVRSAGLRIPQDIGVLGFDDFEWAEFLDPPMTVVDQHIDQIGRIAGDMLVAMMSASAASEGSVKAVPAPRVAVRPTLVVRQSCRALRAPAR